MNIIDKIKNFFWPMPNVIKRAREPFKIKRAGNQIKQINLDHSFVLIKGELDEISIEKTNKDMPELEKTNKDMPELETIHNELRMAFENFDQFPEDDRRILLNTFENNKIKFLNLPNDIKKNIFIAFIKYTGPNTEPKIIKTFYQIIDNVLYDDKYTHNYPNFIEQRMTNDLNEFIDYLIISKAFDNISEEKLMNLFELISNPGKNFKSNKVSLIYLESIIKFSKIHFFLINKAIELCLDQYKMFGFNSYDKFEQNKIFEYIINIAECDFKSHVKILRVIYNDVDNLNRYCNKFPENKKYLNML